MSICCQVRGTEMKLEGPSSLALCVGSRASTPGS